MLFVDATTTEEKTAISGALAATLTELGVKNAKVYNKTSTLSGRRWKNIKGGSVLSWNVGATVLTLTRYAEGDSFTPTRVVNAGIYLEAILEAGFVAELDGKLVRVLGRL
jgi:hypothetical protein